LKIGDRDIMILKYLSVKYIAFIVGLIILLLIMPKIVDIVLLFFAAYVFACAMDPAVEKIQSKVRNNRTVASILVVCGGILAVFALFAPIIFIAFNEIKAFISIFPNKIAAVTRYLTDFQLYGHKIADYISLSSIIDTTPDIAQNLFNQSINITMGIFQFFVVAVAIGMIVFYLLMDKKYIYEKFIELFPPELKQNASFISTSISSKVGGYVRAQILSMTTIGIMQMVMLMILGVEYPLLLGLITGILDIVPILGPVIALAIILLVAAPMSILKLFLIIITFFIIQQASNILVRPIVFGKFMKLHPLTIFLALFLSEQFLGFWGVILSPAIASTVCVLIDELYIKPINEKHKVILQQGDNTAEEDG